MITTVDGLRHGQLVRSIKGRDRNHYYLIVGMVGERFIKAVNGKNHPFSKPKFKNIKHVKVIMLVAKEIETALAEGDSIMDSMVVSIIKRLTKELEEGDRLDG
jgi:large subunit ribosomal protein L14e